MSIVAKRSPVSATAELLSTATPALNVRHLHLAPALGMTKFEMGRDIRRQEIRIPDLSCGVVCVILRLAVSVEHRLVTGIRTN